jgi:hypothetical protein
VPGLVPVVNADVDEVGFGVRHVVNDCPNTLRIGKVRGIRDLRSGSGCRRRIDREDVEILVAVVIFCEENVLAIPAPESNLKPDVSFPPLVGELFRTARQRLLPRRCERR